MENMFFRNGEPVDVTRIEWDLLYRGRWRWTAWSRNRRLQSIVVPVEALDKMLHLSRIFLKTMAHVSRDW